MQVDNFRNYKLYEQSLALMIAIYRLIDHYALDPDDQKAKGLYRSAIRIPKLIASGIGQTNMNVRIKRFNEAKEKLDDLWVTIRFYGEHYRMDGKYLDEIKDNRIQVVKLLNGYFGSLKNGL